MSKNEYRNFGFVLEIAGKWDGHWLKQVTKWARCGQHAFYPCRSQKWTALNKTNSADIVRRLNNIDQMTWKETT